MPRTVAIGVQDFEVLIKNNYFYIDKTDFIREWWESGDIVTLITRPRRFGKTLNMNMLERFLSIEYAGQGATRHISGTLFVFCFDKRKELSECKSQNQRIAGTDLREIFFFKNQWYFRRKRTGIL